MKENKKLIVTITDGGKPAFATECKLFAGVTLLDDNGTARALLLGRCTDDELAAVVAALYRFCEEIEKKHGREFKKLVKAARKAERVVHP